MPDIFDIDRAFEALAHDVMDRTAPPSAFAAIEQARRRRRTAIAAVALAAAVVVGGVAVPTLAGGGDSSGVVATEGLRALPAPAEFAPEGWGPVSDKESDLSPTSSSCLSAFLQQSPSQLQPVATGESVLGRDDNRVLAVFSDFGEDARGAEQAIGTAADLSAGCGKPTLGVRYTDGQVDRFIGAANNVTTDISIARLGNRVAISFVIAKAPSTDDGATAMADALMGALQYPDTWQVAGATPSSSESQAAFAAEVNDATIDGLFGDWFPAWRQGPVDGGLPCAALTWDSPASGSGSMPGGGVSITSYTWPTPAEAATARQELVSALEQCNSTQWTIDTAGGSAWVATSDAGSLWIAEDDGEVRLFEVREGVDPPARVSADVATLLANLM